MAVVENGAAMLPKALVEMALVLRDPQCTVCRIFAFNEIDTVFGFF